MGELNELSFPDNVRYNEDHSWVRIKGDIAVIGITDYAQNQLGDLTFVDLPEEGRDPRKRGKSSEPWSRARRPWT